MLSLPLANEVSGTNSGSVRVWRVAFNSPPALGIVEQSGASIKSFGGRNAIVSYEREGSFSKVTASERFKTWLR